MYSKKNNINNNKLTNDLQKKNDELSSIKFDRSSNLEAIKLLKNDIIKLNETKNELCKLIKE
jgi:hypothetical protein